MSLSPVPNLPFAIDTTRWEEFQARYERLSTAPDETNLTDWLGEWSQLNKLIEETGAIAHIEKTLDTADEAAEQAFLNFIENVAPGFRHADQALKQRLLAQTADDGALGEGMRVPLRAMRNQSDLFREANVPLMTDLAKLGNEYDKITGGLTADWDGEERNLSQLNALLRLSLIHI